MAIGIYLISFEKWGKFGWFTSRLRQAHVPDSIEIAETMLTQYFLKVLFKQSVIKFYGII